MTLFLPLFSLSVTHAYRGGVSEDFDFAIPNETARLLRGGRLLAKTQDGVLRVLFEANEAGHPRVRLTGQTFRIGLRTSNPAVAVFTSPPLPVAPEVLFFRNLGVPDALDAPETRTLVGNLCAHALATPARPLIVTLKDAAGSPLWEETVTAANDRPSVSLDLRGAPLGPLSVEERDGAGGSATRLYYAHPELRAGGVVGVVDVLVGEQSYSNAPAFNIELAARRDTLKYYIVVRGYNEAELSITDGGAADPDDPRPAIDFARVPATAFGADDLSPALLALDGARVVMFKSTQPVARRVGSPGTELEFAL